MGIHDTHIGRHDAMGWWLEEAGRVEPLPPLSTSLDADVVVVGGGYTGMWSAWHVLQADPSARVVLLESGLCGHGPSGRNGGFCESMWLAAHSLKERFGAAPARALLDATSRSVSQIGAWCEENGVDAWFRQSGYICVSTAPAFDDAGRASARAAAELGAPQAVQELSEEQVRARCNSPVFRCGVFVPDFGTLQPARLALGLRAKLLERGVRIFERSRVSGLGGDRGGVVAQTDGGGSVRASAAVLAVGPRTRAVDALSSRLTVTSSHIVMTEPVPDVLEEAGWTGGECITDGRLLLHYFRTTPDGRIVLGWGGGRLACGARVNGRVEVDADVVAQVARDLEWMFPGVRGRRLTHAWGGPIDVSPAHIPQIGSFADAPVHYAFGFTGNGVGPTQLAGRTLASLALDRRDELTRLPIVGADAGAWVPPEPLTWLGGNAVRSAILRVEAAKERGAQPDPLSRAAAAVPRALGMHLGR
jgi:glycine/D-amino acid oxidase-like deaminating enzyme